jgi:cell wall-associated NlpC family hydrolase
MPVKASYLFAAGGGVILLWSGFTGKNASKVLRSIMSGKNPQTVTADYQITTSPAAYSTASGVAASAGATTTGTYIAQDAQRYIGAGYVWGGVPGPSGVGPWDCSSFSNAVIGRDLGLAIPLYKPGTYHGQAHGPPTGVWLVWTGAFTINRKDCAPGDLCIWQSHMGIAVSNSQYVSAYDTQDGTIQRAINGGGPPLEKLFIRRLKAVTARG